MVTATKKQGRGERGERRGEEGHGMFGRGPTSIAVGRLEMPAKAAKQNGNGRAPGPPVATELELD